MSAQELQTLLLDGWKREVIRVSIADCDEKLICQLLCCEKPAQYGIWEDRMARDALSFATQIHFSIWKIGRNSVLSLRTP